MNKTNKHRKIIACKSIKYKDDFFKSITGGRVKKGYGYKAYEIDSGYMIVLDNVRFGSPMAEPQPMYIYIEDIGRVIEDARFVAEFDLVSAKYMAENGIPEFESEVDDMINFISEDAPLEEASKEEPDLMDDFGIDIDEDSEEVGLLLDSYYEIKETSPNLSAGILSAITGVKNVFPGELLDEDKSKLITALKSLIASYEKSGSIDDILMAQYLLFNIVNLANNKWNN